MSSDNQENSLLVMMTEVKGQLALSNQKMDGLIALVNLGQDHIKADNQTIRQQATHDRANVKMQFEAVEKMIEKKADRDDFKALWGHITKGVWIVLGTVITALVAMVVKTHVG